MTSVKFPWLYSNCSTEIGDGNSMFSNVLYSDNQENKYYSPICEDLIKHISPLDIIRIKANLRPGTTFPSGGGFHTDYVNMTTAIFYINTNNGGTKFKNGRKVKSVANRMLIFDSNLMHQSVSCTDKKRRIVINFNFKTNLNNQK